MVWGVSFSFAFANFFSDLCWTGLCRRKHAETHCSRDARSRDAPRSGRIAPENQPSKFNFTVIFNVGHMISNETTMTRNRFFKVFAMSRRVRIENSHVQHFYVSACLRSVSVFLRSCASRVSFSSRPLPPPIQSSPSSSPLPYLPLLASVPKHFGNKARTKAMSRRRAICNR